MNIFKWHQRGHKHFNQFSTFEEQLHEKWNKTEKDRRNEIPDLNSLKPLEFEPKINIGDINISSSHHEEEGVEYKVKWISNSEWCKCSVKALVGRCSTK